MHWHHICRSMFKKFCNRENFVSDMISKAKFNRLRSLQAVMGNDASNTTLDVADEIRAVARNLVDWISDALVFNWLAAGFLNARRVGDLKQSDFFHMLGWYYIARWSENNQTALRLADEIGLQRLAALEIQNTPYEGLNYTGAMLALYHYRSDVNAALSMNGSYTGEDLIHWFYIHGIQEYKLQRCVSLGEIEALNRPLSTYQASPISILDLWALSRQSSPAAIDMTLAPGQIAAKKRATEIRKSDPVFDIFNIGSEYLPDKALEATKSFPWLTSTIAKAERSQYRVIPGYAEYFGKHLSGNRLLLPGEWHDPDDGYVWTKYPSGSILFSVDDVAEFATPGQPTTDYQRGITKIGLAIHPYAGASGLGQVLTVFLNGQFIADAFVSDMLTAETILIENVAASVTRQTTNLLQLIISRPLIPSEHLNSHDTRRLGLALRRIWFG